MSDNALRTFADACNAKGDQPARGANSGKPYTDEEWSAGARYNWEQTFGVQIRAATSDLVAVLEWMRDRDDANGSLPAAYREKIDETLKKAGPADDHPRHGERA